MKLVITGGSGFIATHCIQYFQRQNHEITVLSRSRPNKNLRDVFWYSVSYEDEEKLKKILFSKDVIFHIASSLRYFPIQKIVEVNEQLTAKIVTICNQLTSPPKFVLVSSQAAGGPSIQGRPRNEQDASEPISYYGMSKLASEKKLYSSDFWWTIQRPPAVFGPEEKDIVHFLKLAKKGITIQIGNQERKFSWIYVHDVITSLEKCIYHDDLKHKFWYVRSGDTTWNEFAHTVVQILQRKVVSVKLPEIVIPIVKNVSSLKEKFTQKPTLLNEDKLRELVIPDWRCDDTFFRNVTHWKPTYSLQSALQETLQWLEKNE
ncbi:MAG: NAD(P)-dependent oxidoreductase [bacterium]|nr:NAD(P)-dependent oxidoreductase [bacterium]